MKQQQQTMMLSPRANAERKYNLARANLLLALIFTVVNVVLTLVNADIYFLFSAFMPLVAVELGIGMATEFGTTVMVLLVAIGIALLVPCLLCWIFSKKKMGWMIAALVYFVFDTAFLLLFALLLGMLTSIIDILFHAWIIYYMIVGVKAGIALKTLPEDEEPELASIDGAAEKNVWDDITPPEA